MPMIQSLNLENQGRLLELFLQGCLSSSTPYSAKQHINLVIESLLMVVLQNKETNSAGVYLIYEKMIEYTSNSMKNLDVEVIKGCLLVFQSVFQSLQSISDLQYLFSKIQSTLIQLIEYFIKQFSLDIIVLPTLPPAELTLHNPHVVKVMNSLEIIFNWVKIHYNAFERYQSKKYFGFQLFSSSVEYCNIFKNILGLHVAHPNQTNQTILSLTGLEKLDNQLNLIKGKAMESINMVFKYTVDQSTPQKLASPFYS